MATTISTLAAKLVLDTGQWVAGFGKAGKVAQTFASQTVTGVARQAGAMATAIVGSVASVHALSKSFSNIDRQAKLADRLGLTNEAVQKLSLAADLAGTDVETLAHHMLNMGKNIGSGGMSLDKRFFAVADSIAKMEDPARRAKEAMRVFGKGGFELINLLSQGGKGIRQSADAIERFGLGISRIDAAEVEAANDALTVMGTVLRGVSDRIAVELAPNITNFVNLWLEGMELIGRSGSVFSGWGDTLRGVLSEAIAELAGFQAVVEDIFQQVTTGTTNHSGKSLLAVYFETIKDSLKGMQEASGAASGPRLGKFSPAIFGGGGIGGHMEHPGAFERGSVEAARTIQATSNNSQTTQDQMLEQLKAIRAALDPMKRDGRDGDLKMAEAGI